MLGVNSNSHMGQFLQDGNFGHFMSLFCFNTFAANDVILRFGH